MIFMLIEFIIESLLLIIKDSNWFFSWYNNLWDNQSLFFDWEFVILEFIVSDNIFNVQIMSEIVNTSLIKCLKKRLKTVNINSSLQESWARCQLNHLFWIISFLNEITDQILKEILFNIKHVSIWLIYINKRSSCSKNYVNKLILSSWLEYI